VKDSLKAVFPERSHLVDQNVDTGEYGAESRSIRWLCCFIFMMDVMNELENVVNMCRFFYSVPSAPEPWIEIQKVEDDESQDGTGTKDVLGVKVAGMPLYWKVFSVCTILVPKALLWRLTAEAGICFLMETAAIDDMIVNAVGLTFILQVDESICGTLMSSVTQELLEQCNEYHESGMPAQKEHTETDELQQSFIQALYGIVPFRLVNSILLTSVFVLKYYLDHCYWKSDGMWFASKPMYLPKTTDFTILNTLFPNFFPVPSQAESYWELPKSNE